MTLKPADAVSGKGMDSATPLFPRKPWLAVLFSFLSAGLGQVYNGQWKKGLVFCCMENLVGYALILGMASFSGFMASLCVLLLVNGGVAADAFFSARSRQAYQLGPCNRIWIYALVLLVNVGAGAVMDSAVTDRYYKSFKVPSESMLPTLKVGDHFIARIFSETSVVRRGDIVVFVEPESGKYYVKRVIGLPGESVAMKDKTVLIDGQPLNEPYVQHTKPDVMPRRDDLSSMTIAADAYFCMGDNRENSWDSRWLGAIRRDAILGRAAYIYFPGNMGSADWMSRFGLSF